VTAKDVLEGDRLYRRDWLATVTGLQDDEHGKDTPERFEKMLEELTQCKTLHQPQWDEEHLVECVKWKDFPAEGEDMIIVEQIPFNSVCNHHIIPFIGVAHIAYVPREREVGLSKLGRVVQHFARQLQVQERMTRQIADFIEERLQPRGVGVVVKAEHLCMTIRGVQLPGTRTTTASMRGVFADHDRTAKAEFLAAINGR
jgi:GTP cyclohydrolase I